MRAKDVAVGMAYVVRVSGRLTQVRINSAVRSGGWNGTNLATGRAVRIRTAARLRAAAGNPAAPMEDLAIPAGNLAVPAEALTAPMEALTAPMEDLAIGVATESGALAWIAEAWLAERVRDKIAASARVAAAGKHRRATDLERDAAQVAAGKGDER